MAIKTTSAEGLDAPKREISDDEKRPNKELVKLQSLQAVEPLMFLDTYVVPTKYGSSTMVAFVDVEGEKDYDPEDHLDKYDNVCEAIVIGDVTYPVYGFFADCGEKAGAFAKAMIELFCSDKEGKVTREDRIGQVFKIGKSADIQSKSSQYSYNELRYKVLGADEYNGTMASAILAEYKAIQAGFGKGGDSRDTFADDGKAMAADEASGMPTGEAAAAAKAMFDDGKKMMHVIKGLVDGMEMTEDDASDLAMAVKAAM